MIKSKPKEASLIFSFILSSDVTVQSTVMLLVATEALPHIPTLDPEATAPLPQAIWLSPVAAPSAESPMKVLFEPVVILKLEILIQYFLFHSSFLQLHNQ